MIAVVRELPTVFGMPSTVTVTGTTAVSLTRTGWFLRANLPLSNLVPNYSTRNLSNTRSLQCQLVRLTLCLVKDLSECIRSSTIQALESTW